MRYSSLLVSLSLSLLLSHCLIAPAHANQLSGLTLVGQGKMQWYFLEVYHAELYSENGTFPAQELALQIEYRRSISRENLVTATLEQWDHLNTDYPAHWETAMQTLWPSVEAGDVLTLRVGANGSNRFYFNHEYLGTIDDNRFGRAFIDIWLSPNTTQPGLRKQLLGNR